MSCDFWCLVLLISFEANKYSQSVSRAVVPYHNLIPPLKLCASTATKQQKGTFSYCGLETCPTTLTYEFDLQHRIWKKVPLYFATNFAKCWPIFSESRHLLSLVLSVCLSSVVCMSSVTLVRPSQAVEIFGNISTTLGTLAKNFTEIVAGEPLRRGVKHNRGSQI